MEFLVLVTGVEHVYKLKAIDLDWTLVWPIFDISGGVGVGAMIRCQVYSNVKWLQKSTVLTVAHLQSLQQHNIACLCCT